jgi:superfamily II DNA/RNA helicase
LTNFTDFDFIEQILKVLQEMDYKTPTPIQKLAIPKILEGKDVIASAQTGTGKTAAFMLPILHLLSQPSYKNNASPQILILVPTRELAMQVAEEAKKFSKYLPKIKTVCIYGGVPYPLQRKALNGRYEILVATPGRLMDHLEQGRIDLSQVKMLVLDEADRMLDMGFIDAVEHIANSLPKKRQTLLFSATIDKKILPFSRKLQTDPHEIQVELTQSMQNNIEQRLYYVDGVNHKIRILEHILENTEISQSIVFTSTINQANDLADYLQDKGYRSEALHGDMKQGQRTRTINKLRCGSIKFLIATDVAGRGIDIPSLSHIFNFDLPFQAEDFIHRVGRTGRAGAKGVAITFSTHREELKLSKINKIMGKPLELHVIEGMEPKAKRNDGPYSHRQRSDRPSRGPGGPSRGPGGPGGSSRGPGGPGGSSRGPGGPGGSSRGPGGPGGPSRYGRENGFSPKKKQPSYNRPSADSSKMGKPTKQPQYK